MAKTVSHETIPQRVSFHRPLRTRDIPARGLSRLIEATAEECAAVAAATGLTAVSDLRADIRVELHANERYDLTGSVTATITQVCVVTLEPFESTVTQPIAISFSDQPSQTVPSQHRAVDIDVFDPDEQPDPPDPVVNNTIDLGAVAVEFLTLALDFYPKKPGVEFADVTVGEPGPLEPSSFAALERLKDRS
jgi:hypothetical protein